MISASLTIAVLWSAVLISTIVTNPVIMMPQEFGVVIDAGSSGSRVRVYRWPRRSHDHDIPDVEEIYNHKVKPGISSFAGLSSEEIREYILELLARAEDQVPTRRHADTAIYFMATAGMRMLAEEEADHLMAEVDAVLSDVTMCPFRYNHINTRILSGEEEGAFAWVAINYLRGYFTEESVDDVGVLEMGGASAQVAFIPSGSLLANKFPVYLGGQEYPLYVHSYLGYGATIARQHAIEELSDDDDSSEEEPGEVLDPCMSRGDEVVEILEDRRVVTMIGTSDPQGCMDLIGELVYDVDDDRCHPKPCAIGPFYQPHIPEDMDFYAVSAFVYTPLDLDDFVNGTLLDNADILVPDELFDVTWDWCSKNITEIETIMGRSSPFFNTRCNLGLYTYKLFTDAFGFDGATDKIKMATMVNGEPIAWPLGALLYETNNTPVPER